MAIPVIDKPIGLQAIYIYVYDTFGEIYLTLIIMYYMIRFMENIQKLYSCCCLSK